ncbi:MAG: hypothetical protein AAF696_11785 [Bacteroidota bacterium]
MAFPLFFVLYSDQDYKKRKDILTKYSAFDHKASYSSEEEKIKALDETIEFSEQASALFKLISAFKNEIGGQSLDSNEKLEKIVDYINTQNFDSKIKENAIELIRHDAISDKNKLVNEVTNQFPSLKKRDLQELVKRYELTLTDK